MMLKQIKYFITVIDNNSFTEASEILFISQSAISQQIRALEESLGVQLIKRENRRFSLTPAGDYFYRQCKEVLSELEDIKQETMRIGQDKELQLRIGYLTGYCGDSIRQAVSEFAKQYPEIYMDIYEGTHEELYEQLRDDVVDLVLNDQRRVFSDEYKNVQVAELKSFIEVSSGFEISKKDFLTIEQLRRIPCILVVSKEQQIHEREFFQNTLGFSGNFLFTESLENARLMVLAGRGFLLSDGTKNEEVFFDVARVPLYRSESQLKRNYCVFWKKKNTNYYIEEFADLLKKQFIKDE